MIDSHRAKPVDGIEVDDLLPVDDTLRGLLLDESALVERQQHADRLLRAEGAGYLVHDLPLRGAGRATAGGRPWRLDPIPVVLDARTFDWLAAAVAERMGSIETVLADLYGARRVVADGVVDAQALSSSSRFRLGSVETAVPRWLSVYGCDVALGADGVWYLVRDRTDAPSGIGYSMLNRSVTGRVMPDVLHTVGPAALAPFPNALRRALAAVSDAESPRIVVFSGGPDHRTYVDHSYLAVQLGVHLVEGADLVVRSRQVWLRTLAGLEPVDVLYRRVDDPHVDPLEVDAQGAVGVPGLLQAVRSSGVTLANAHGTGVVEDPALDDVFDAAIAHLAPLAHTLPRWHPTIPLATVPTVGPDGQLTPQVTVIRLYAVSDSNGIRVMPGGSGRILADGDHPAHPTSASVKDVWVLTDTVVPAVPPRLPQVDLQSSLPTRAADALYWSSRAAERAETIARMMRVVLSRIEADQFLLDVDEGRLAARLDRLLDAATGVSFGSAEPVADAESPGTADRFVASIDRTAGLLAAELGKLLGEAVTVREYLSGTTGRVLADLADARDALNAGAVTVDDLDSVLAGFAAFVGLWHESTVRGPAWRIGDAGRRLERCQIVLDLTEAALGPDGDGRLFPPLADDPNELIAEVLLAANESLVAYRRRHRSDVEPSAAINLLVHDRTNPRSLAASIDALEQAVVGDGWQPGSELVARAREAMELPYRDLLPTMRTVVHDATMAIIGRWFSSPVAPIVMRREANPSAPDPWAPEPS